MTCALNFLGSKWSKTKRANAFYTKPKPKPNCHKRQKTAIHFAKVRKFLEKVESIQLKIMNPSIFQISFLIFAEKKETMDYKTVIIELSNGQTRHIPMYEFDYYAHSNELEHKTEHIIICIDNLSRSFLYATDERGEIENKELITKVSFSK